MSDKYANVKEFLKQINKEDYKNIERAVLMNTLNTCSFIILNGYKKEIENSVSKDDKLTFKDIFEKVRSSIKKPENFINNYVEFIKDEDFKEVFFDYMSTNAYTSWNFDLPESLEDNIDKFSIERSDIIEYFINEVIVIKIDDLVVEYKLVNNLEIVDEFIDSFVTGVLSMKIMELND